MVRTKVMCWRRVFSYVNVGVLICGTLKLAFVTIPELSIQRLVTGGFWSAMVIHKSEGVVTVGTGPILPMAVITMSAVLRLLMIFLAFDIVLGFEVTCTKILTKTQMCWTL